MPAQWAFALLVGVYVSSACGGSIPAVLLEIPGTASAMVTAEDGFKMRQKGGAGSFKHLYDQFRIWRTDQFPGFNVLRSVACFFCFKIRTA